MPPQGVELVVKRLRENARVPARGTASSTGLDLCACLEAPMMLGRAPQRVPTGIAIEIATGYDAQVRPRSGLSLKGIGVALGTIDADYRGELLVTMWMFGDLDSYELKDGDRIAQLVIGIAPPVLVVEADELSDTVRGTGGHGSTGR